MIGSISQDMNGGLRDMLLSLKTEKGKRLDLLPSEKSAAQPLLPENPQADDDTMASSDLVAGSLVSTESEDSKYLKGTLGSFAVRKQLDNQVTSSVNSLLNSLGGIELENKGEKHPAAWYEMQVRRIRNADSFESSKKNLDEIQENIEQKAKEATGQADANGAPAAITADEAPVYGMPDASGATLDAAPEGPAGTATMPEASAIPGPAAPPVSSSPGVQEAPSIDIMV